MDMGADTWAAIGGAAVSFMAAGAAAMNAWTRRQETRKGATGDEDARHVAGNPPPLGWVSPYGPPPPRREASSLPDIAEVIAPLNRAVNETVTKAMDPMRVELQGIREDVGEMRDDMRRMSDKQASLEVANADHAARLRSLERMKP